MRERLRTLLFGHDIFVSYSRKDGKTYATGLAEALLKRGFATAIDRWETQVAGDLPSPLRRKIKSSRMLVVVASEGAAASAHVGAEIDEFVRTKRHFILVDFGGAIERASWLSLIPGRERDAEPERNPTALELGIPSDNVLALIGNSFGYIKRNRRLQITFAATAAGIVAILAIGAALVAYQRYLADHQKQLAEAATRQAEQQTKAAKAAAAETDRQKHLADQQMRLATARRSAAALQARASDDGYNTPRDIAEALNIANALSELPVEANNLLSDTVSRVGKRVASLRQNTAISATLAMPETDWLVTAGADSRIRIWDIAKQQLNRTIDAGVEATSLSVDGAGNRLAVAGASTVHLMDLAGKSAVRTYSRMNGVRRVRLSGSGRFMAIALDESLVLKDLEQGRDIPVDAWVPGVRDAVFTPDDRLLMVEGFEDESWWFRVIDVRTGKQTTPDQPGLKAFGGRRATLGPNGRLLSTSCHSSEGRPGGCVVRVFQTPEFKQIIQAPHTFNTIEQFSSDNRYLLTLEAGIARLFDVRTGRQLSAAQPVPTADRALISADGSHFAVAAPGTIRVVESITGELSAVAAISRDSEPVALSKNGSRAVVVDRKSGRIDIWRMRGAHSLTGLAPSSYAEGGRVNMVAVSPNRAYAAITDTYQGEDLNPHAAVSLWDLVENRVVWQVADIEEPSGVAFSRNGRWVAMIDPHGVQLRSVDGAQQRSLRRDGPVRDIACGRRGWLVIPEGESVRAEELETGRPVASFNHQSAIDRRLSTDGSVLGSVDSKGKVRTFDLDQREEREIQLTRGGFGTRIAWIRKLVGGDIIVAAGGDSLEVWNVSRAIRIAGDVPMTAAAITLAGEVLAASDGSRVRIMDTASGKLLADRRAPGTTTLAFTAADRLITAGRRVQVWLWRSSDLIAAACSLFTSPAGRGSSVPHWDDVRPENEAVEVCRDRAFHATTSLRAELPRLSIHKQ